MADKRFAQGGPVSGPRDGDEVPMLLDPPGYILTWRMVEAIAGSDGLRKIREKLRGETDGRDG